MKLRTKDGEITPYRMQPGIHQWAREIYSAKRPRNDLADQGVQTIPYQSEHYDRNWVCVASKNGSLRWQPTPGIYSPIAPDVLSRNLQVAPEKAWASDISVPQQILVQVSKTLRWHQNRRAMLLRYQQAVPADRLHGAQHRGGASLIQAFTLSCGNLRWQC